MSKDLFPRPRVLDDRDPTHARPEPWFVGSGTGLTIGVLALIAVLLVLRAASLVWLVEDGRAWWQGRMRATARPAAPPPALRPFEQFVPLPSGGRAAVARAPEADWITSDDYPPDAIREGEQGRVSIAFTIGIDGRVAHCHTRVSSGSARLDDAACRAFTAHGRYRPARDAAGRPVTSTRTRWVSWRLTE